MSQQPQATPRPTCSPLPRLLIRGFLVVSPSFADFSRQTNPEPPSFVPSIFAGRQTPVIREARDQVRQAAMDSGSPVMTESERRAYRYAQAPRVQGVQGLGVRKSWSNDSLFSLVGSGSRGGVISCVCAPTTHPGSFRCKHHRQNQNAYHLGGAGHAQAQSTAEADTDAKSNEVHGEISSAEQEKAS